MKKIKEKAKSVFLDKKLYLFTIITFLFFGIYCLMQFAPDTYSVFTNSVKQNTSHFLSCGRVVTALFFYMTMGVLKWSNTAIYMISYSIAIICMIASLYLLYKLFKKDIKNERICIISSILLVINIFSIELFVYIEKGIMMLSVLLCILAVIQIRNFFEGSKKAIIWATLLMLIANCCYQGTVGIFIAISLIYIIKYAKNIKEFVINNLIVAVTYGIPALINFFMVRFLFTNSRVKGEIILSESLEKLYQGTKNMILGTYDLFPKYLFAIILFILIVWIIYKIVRKSIATKTKILEILSIAYIVIGTIFATVAPQILQDTGSIWFVARSSYPVAALLGILLAYAATKVETKKNAINIITILSCLILVIQFIYFARFTIDNYIVNYEDRQNVEQIQKILYEYEQETGKQVTKIAFYEDEYPGYTYSHITAYGDMNLKAIYKNWSALRAINYYTNRNLEEVEKVEKIQNDFQKEEWSYFDKEQLIIIDDTIHLCIY